MPTITPFLWFDHDLSEALEFYAGVFGDLGVKVLQGSLGGAGLLVARFTVLGQTFADALPQAQARSLVNNHEFSLSRFMRMCAASHS